MSFPVRFINTISNRYRLSLIGVLFALLSLPALASEWSIKDLGTLGGDSSVATGINNLGQVTGYSLLPPRPSPILDGELASFDNAFLSAPNGGTITSLGELGELGSRATSLNDAGRVVGTSYLFGDLPASFTTGPGGTPMNELSGFVTATDINNAGQVAGRDDLSGFAFITAPNSNAFILIDTPDGAPAFESATAINDSGLVTLDSGNVWSQAGGRQAIAPGVDSAVGVNNSGQVIGLINNKAFITAPNVGALTLLGTLGGDFSIATGVNNSGQVVGLSATADGQTHAFVSGVNGTSLIDLETLKPVMSAGWSNLRVAAINDNGQIAGTGIINGKQRAFFLSPVPEPATYALMLTGFGLLAFVHARRRRFASLAVLGSWG